MSTTLDDNELGQAKSEEHHQYSDLDFQGFPLSASAEAWVFDYVGVKRRITITGEYSAATKASIMDDFILKIEALQDGNQTGTVTFHSDIYAEGSGEDGKFDVKVDSFRWIWKVGPVLMVEYTIVLLEGV